MESELETPMESELETPTTTITKTTTRISLDVVDRGTLGRVSWRGSVNGTNVAYDPSTESFFVATGAEGYSICAGAPFPDRLNCTARDVQLSKLSRVDDLAVSNGSVFLLDTNLSQLAVVQVDGTVIQEAAPATGAVANFRLQSTSYKKKDQGLCQLATNPDAGLVVLCNEGDPSSQQSFVVAETQGAQSVAVSGDRAFVVRLIGEKLRLDLVDLAPLDNNNAPKFLCFRSLTFFADDSISPPVSVAASPDGQQVLVVAPNYAEGRTAIFAQNLRCRDY